MTDQQSQLVGEYLSSFTEQQHLVMNVAIEKLGSSFNVAKSNGFVKWMAKRGAPQPPSTAPLPQAAAATPSLATPSPATDSQAVIPKRKLVVKRLKVTRSPSDATVFSKLAAILAENGFPQPQSHLEFDASKRPKVETEGGSLYCIFSDTSMLYVGTTSDTKKNFALAFKGVIKTIKQAESQDGTSAIPSKLYAVISETEDNKKRVRLRDVIKKAFGI
jgi:hypothetical protein